MADNIDQHNEGIMGVPEQDATNSQQNFVENIAESKNADAMANDDGNVKPSPGGVEAGGFSASHSTEYPEQEETELTYSESHNNNMGNNATDTNPSASPDKSGAFVSPLADDTIAASSPITIKSEFASTGDESTHVSRPPPEDWPSGSTENKIIRDKTAKKSSQLSIREADAQHRATPTYDGKEKTIADVSYQSLEKPPQNAPHQKDDKPSEPSVKNLVRKPSESSGQKSKMENTSLTARLYEEQIQTGKLNRLTSIMRDQDGTERLVFPGSVTHWNTVDISLTGKRPMPNERCRKGEHNCFQSAAARRERALSASLAQGLYPDFMRLNPKLKEFVAASILEKLRLKGLAAPLHIYKGRNLPSNVLAEMVLKPKKRKVTDRYYFGYVPPPNRPRLSTEFRRYLQRFAERHRAAESDLCFSHALKIVRQLAEQSVDPLPLSQTLAEVIRAQEEPGFGVRRLRRPHTDVI